MAQDIVPDSIEEAVAFSWRDTLLRALWSYSYFTAILASLVIIMAATIGVFFAIGGPAPVARLRAMLVVLVRFFAFSWCFCSVVILPLSFYWAIRSRKRTIRASAGRLLVQVGRRKRDLDLAECMWTVSRFPYDEHGVYWPRRPLVIVGNPTGWHACGFTDRKRNEWEEFLAAAGVEHFPLIDWRQVALVLMITSIAGGVAGLGIGRIAVAFGAPAALVGLFGFLGFLDGALAVLAYLTCVYWWRKHAGRGGFMALIGVIFAALAAKFALMAGPLGALIVVAGNALAGAIVGWYAYGLAARHQQEEAYKIGGIRPRAAGEP